MRELGLRAFRFSIAWPRVLPEGRGRVNAAGLDFYDRLVDDLLAAGIEPFATLYHWDLPQALEDAGGWPVRATAEAFVEYVETVAAGSATASGTGPRTTSRTAPRGWATSSASTPPAGRTSGTEPPPSTTSSCRTASPSTCCGASLRAPRSGSSSTRGRCTRRRATRPTLPRRGRPTAFARASSSTRCCAGATRTTCSSFSETHAPPVHDGDLERISAPLDFVGVNNYSRTVVSASPDGGPLIEVPATDVPKTAMGWEIYPDGLYELLTRLHREYGVETLYVTENGAAFDDVSGADGRIDDPDRIAFLEGYLGAVARAIAEGVPVRGYFVWSLLDNFEWAEGYGRRFGVVYVDYESLARVPKASFHWYRDVIATGRLPALERAPS